MIGNIIKAWENTHALQEIAQKCIASQHAAAHTKCDCSKGGFTKYWNYISIIEFVLSLADKPIKITNETILWV